MVQKHRQMAKMADAEYWVIHSVPNKNVVKNIHICDKFSLMSVMTYTMTEDQSLSTSQFSLQDWKKSECLI